MSASENGHTGGYTPGPWKYYADLPSTDPNWNIVTTENGLRVLANIHIEPGNGMDEANARLIAAAPEMHKTGRKLANEVGGLKAFEHEVRAIIGNTNWSVLMQRLAEADAVLSKAEGRQP
jgi:hypothetical protein